MNHEYSFILTKHPTFIFSIASPNEAHERQTCQFGY